MSKNPPAKRDAPNDLELPDRTDAIIRSFKRYKELQAALDQLMPDAIIILSSKEGKKPFRKKQYWNAVALALGVDVQLVSEEPVVYEVEEGATRKTVRGYQVLYRATLPGREALGDGACTTDEPRVYGTYHNVRARAHTRGRNRAIANLVAFGEVSAEEADLGGDANWPEDNG